MWTSDTYRELKLVLRLDATICWLPIGFNGNTGLINDILLWQKPIVAFMTTVLFFRTNYRFANLIYGFFKGVPSVADTAVESFFATCLPTNLGLQLGLHFGRDVLTDPWNQVFWINKTLGGLLIPQAKKGITSGDREKIHKWLYRVLANTSYFSLRLTSVFRIIFPKL